MLGNEKIVTKSALIQYGLTVPRILMTSRAKDALRSSSSNVAAHWSDQQIFRLCVYEG